MRGCKCMVICRRSTGINTHDSRYDLVVILKESTTHHTMIKVSFYWASLITVAVLVWLGGQTQVSSVVSECRSQTGYEIVR